MGKYYKLYLNNNQNKYCCDFELEGVIQETIIVQQEKKQFLEQKLIYLKMNVLLKRL